MCNNCPSPEAQKPLADHYSSVFNLSPADLTTEQKAALLDLLLTEYAPDAEDEMNQTHRIFVGLSGTAEDHHLSIHAVESPSGDMHRAVSVPVQR